MFTGSEKQIEWAMKIKATWIAQIDEQIETARVRVSDKSMPEKWLTIVNKHSDIVLSKIKNINKAETFINGRGNNCGSLLLQEASKEYNKLNQEEICIK